MICDRKFTMWFQDLEAESFHSTIAMIWRQRCPTPTGVQLRPALKNRLFCVTLKAYWLPQPEHLFLLAMFLFRPGNPWPQTGFLFLFQHRVLHRWVACIIVYDLSSLVDLNTPEEPTRQPYKRHNCANMLMPWNNSQPLLGRHGSRWRVMSFPLY